MLYNTTREAPQAPDLALQHFRAPASPLTPSLSPNRERVSIKTSIQVPSALPQDLLCQALVLGARAAGPHRQQARRLRSQGMYTHCCGETLATRIARLWGLVYSVLGPVQDALSNRDSLLILRFRDLSTRSWITTPYRLLRQSRGGIELLRPGKPGIPHQGDETG
jgi:hypothetical protein